MKLQRRELLKWLTALPLAQVLTSCAPKDQTLRLEESKPPERNPRVTPLDEPQYKSALEYSTNRNFNPGYLTIVQGPTSDSETLINILSPRLKNYKYEIVEPNGSARLVEIYQRVSGPVFYHVDKIRVMDLRPNVEYTLNVLEISSSSGSRTVIDSRQFSTLDLQKTQAHFAVVSCMADDYRFDEIINPMWAQLQKQNPDFLFLTGDLVYVDSKEFVERQKATVADIWQRYVDALDRLPVYHWKKLKPILATWDDHDFGTNDGDRNFIGKQAALELFQALYQGPSLNAGWYKSEWGTASSFDAFGQKFYLMDNRFYRQPNKDQVTVEPYGHWGEGQHKWLFDHLKKSSVGTWVINGNQHFDGAKMTFVESLEQNHPGEFAQFVKDMKDVSAPVAFASGDIHLSEIMRIPESTIGFETYEFTSSSMHSYAGSGWANPLRVEGAYTIEYNFMVFKSSSTAGGKALKVDVSSWGLPKTPYFTTSMVIDRS